MIALAYVLLVAGIGVVVSFLVLAEACRRKLVDYVFAHRHDIWVQSGRPLAGNATRRETSFFSSDIAAYRTLGWVFARPSWLPPDGPAEALRRRAIRYVLLAPTGVVPGAVGVLLAIRYAS